MEPQLTNTEDTLIWSPRLWRELEVEQYKFPVYTLGMDLPQAKAAVICIHNRWSNPIAFAELGKHLISDSEHTDFTIVSLGAPNNQYFWYPQLSFDASLEKFNPYLTLSITALEHLCQLLAEYITIEEISLFGFAEGAALALEYTVHSGNPFNTVLALSGLLVGHNIDSSERFVAASSRTKIFLTCSSTVPAAMRARFRQSEQLLKQFGYKVVSLTYERRPETILPDELAVCKKVLFGTFT